LNWFTRETQALHIARPPEADNALVWRHPNTNIARGAQLTVRSDERAVFFRQGVVSGVLEAGVYKLDTANIPFLGGFINALTGGNHYIAELFFVRMAETRRDLGGDDLGTYRDRASQHMVRMNFSAGFTFRVADPIAFITTLGGQSASSEAMALEIVDGRLRNAVRSVVGKHVQTTPILDVVSNSHSEEFGQSVRSQIAPEFAQQGLEFVRFLELFLDLDEGSAATLQQYQSRVADLTIQAQGAQIAQDPGFAAFNLVQGQKNLLDGMGQGLAQGVRGPIFGLGMGVPGMAGIGMVPPVQPTRGVPQAASSRPSTAAPTRYFIVGDRGVEGPYDAKRLVLVVLSGGKRLEDVRIRQEGDPAEIAISAMDEPPIRQEYERRANRTAPSASKGDLGVFESVFEAAAKDGVMTDDEISMLAPLAVRARLASSESDARVVIAARARAIGCSIGTATPASAAASYAYSVDGGAPENGLDATAIARRVAAEPGRKHWVWQAGFDGWKPADAQPDVRAAIAAMMPPAPPVPPPPPPM
jgi:membrane protease subunit (stomatin/prohibitin family)